MNAKEYDDLSYRRYIGPMVLDKAVNTLEGILNGISLDGELTPLELEELIEWCNEHKRYIKRHPFNEIIPLVELALKDKVLDPEEVKDILFLCANFRSDSVYYDQITSDIQRLQGILHGVLSDHKVSKDELEALSGWLDENDHLRGVYPYDEIESLIVSVLRDGKIEAKEHALLISFFENFVQFSTAKQIKRAREKSRLGIKDEKIRLTGICAVCPEIIFQEQLFCITGLFKRSKRSMVVERIETLKGICNKGMTQRVNYLVVGAGGNPAWAFSCYGRKIQQAIDYRKEGSKLLIVHENDFWDAVEDSS